MKANQAALNETANWAWDDEQKDGDFAHKGIAAIVALDRATDDGAVRLSDYSVIRDEMENDKNHPISKLIWKKPKKTSDQSTEPKKKASKSAPAAEAKALAMGWGEMVRIPPGSFVMGCASGIYNDGPLTRVTLTTAFSLGKTQVTQRSWVAVMGSNPSAFKGESLPVEKVSWDDAMEFCRKLTTLERSAGSLPEGYVYTLPTEAQWEYACRAGTTGDYAGDLKAMAWFKKNAGSTTHAVATKQANAWGLHDMHGNVMEWCADWYAFKLPGGSVSDFKGAASGSYRVIRGGSFCDDAADCRSALHFMAPPGNRLDSLGFRLALSSVP